MPYYTVIFIALVAGLFGFGGRFWRTERPDEHDCPEYQPSAARPVLAATTFERTDRSDLRSYLQHCATADSILQKFERIAKQNSATEHHPKRFIGNDHLKCMLNCRCSVLQRTDHAQARCYLCDFSFLGGSP